MSAGVMSRVEESPPLVKGRPLLLTMLVLQLLWLGAIVVTGTSSNRRAILLLAVYSAVVGLAIILAPRPVITKLWRSLRTWLYDNKNPMIVLGVVALLAGTVYALLQGLWGDEERALRVATIVSRDGLVQAYVESGWLRNKHPPLMPIVYGATVSVFGSNLIPLRLVSTLFLAGSVVVVYLLGRELYDRKTGFLGAGFFLLFPLVVRLGSAAMMDIQVTFFFVAALLCCLRLSRTGPVPQVVAGGTLIGLGLLTKYTMVLILGVLFVSTVFLPRLRAVKYQLATVAMIALAIFGGWLAYANHIDILSDQAQKILEYSGIYHVISDGDAAAQPGPAEDPAETDAIPNPTSNAILRLGLETFTTRLPSALGVHLFPVMVIGTGLLMRRRSTSDLFLVIWIGVVFAALFLTLPDHRYFLPAFPAIALVVANTVRTTSGVAKRLVLLSAALGLGNLYLFVDWIREAHLFL